MNILVNSLIGEKIAQAEILISKLENINKNVLMKAKSYIWTSIKINSLYFPHLKRNSYI